MGECEMLPGIPEEIDEAQLSQPGRVVEGARGVGARKVQELLQLDPLLFRVRIDVVRRQERALGALATRISYQAGAAAHQNDRGPSVPLEMSQQHDGDEVADLQTWCGRVEADVPGDRPAGEPGLERRGRIVQEPAPVEFVEECGHQRRRLRRTETSGKPKLIPLH